jgi:hypothetical protein
MLSTLKIAVLLLDSKSATETIKLNIFVLSMQNKIVSELFTLHISK